MDLQATRYNLAGVYGFLKHVSKLDRLEILHYLEMFYLINSHPKVFFILNEIQT